MKAIFYFLGILLCFSLELGAQEGYALSGGFKTKGIVNYNFPENANQWPSTVKDAKLIKKSKHVVFSSEGRSIRKWLKSIDIDQSRDFQIEVSFSTGLFQGVGGGGFVFGSNGQRYLYFSADYKGNTNCGVSVNGNSKLFERKEPITEYVGNFGISYVFTIRKMNDMYYFFKNGNPFGDAVPVRNVGDLGNTFGFYSYREDDSWQLVGVDSTFQVPRDGVLYLAVNDQDSFNNQNYFDVKITLPNLKSIGTIILND